ncbi:hypothetical protein TFLX_04721 [Thermoflexales bacterium]|nr:hypothetical protein TFLX_04721 [Thermoflexales bacterium]
MSFTPDPPLQPLRIPAGWHVAYNQFFDIEPDMTAEAYSGSWWYFSEDMLQLKHAEWKLLLDLGWYPESRPEGNFKIYLVQLMDDVEEMPDAWESPLATFSSPSRQEIVKTIEAWLLKPPARAKA